MTTTTTTMMIMIYSVIIVVPSTNSSAVAERPRDACFLSVSRRRRCHPVVVEDRSVAPV